MDNQRNYNDSDNPYDVLGVDRENATDRDIRAAYRKLALQHHPDRQNTEEQKRLANEKFAKISHAYEQLTNKDDDNNDAASYYQGRQQQSPMNHFHDPFQVFESVFRNEFGGGGDSRRQRGGGFGHRSPFFDEDPFMDDFFSGFGGSPFFGRGGGSLFDRHFGGIQRDHDDQRRRHHGGGSLFDRHFGIQRDDDHHQQEIDRARRNANRGDPFEDMFTNMRQFQQEMFDQQQQQQSFDNRNNNNQHYSFSSTTTTIGRDGEQVTTTERNVNGKQVKETVTKKLDGTVLNREVEGDEDLLLQQQLPGRRRHSNRQLKDEEDPPRQELDGNGGRRQHNLLPWGRSRRSRRNNNNTDHETKE